MKFLDSDNLLYLWLLPVIIFLLWFSFRQQQKRILRFSKIRWQEIISGRLSTSRTLFKAFLLCFSFTCIFLSLSRPRWGISVERPSSRGH